MSHAIDFDDDDYHSTTVHRGPAYQAYQVLHVGFVVAPVIAGADKFFHLLCDWDKYLAPAVAARAPVSPHAFMLIAGAVEVLAGLLVAIKPRFGAWLVAFWLFAIVANLIMLGGYWDVALRDFGLALGALALGRLSVLYDVHRVVRRARQEAAAY